MKTRADIIDKLEDKYKITAESLTNRELLIIGIATENHDSEVEKLFISVVSNRTCPKCKGEMLPQDDKICIDCWQKYVNV